MNPETDRFSRVFRGFMMRVLSLAIVGYGWTLLARGTGSLGPPVGDNAFPSPLGLIVHIAASSVALLIGAWQFVAGIRARAPRVPTSSTPS